MFNEKSEESLRQSHPLISGLTKTRGAGLLIRWCLKVGLITCKMLSPSRKPCLVKKTPFVFGPTIVFIRSSSATSLTFLLWAAQKDEREKAQKETNRRIAPEIYAGRWGLFIRGT